LTRRRRRSKIPFYMALPTAKPLPTLGKIVEVDGTFMAIEIDGVIPQSKVDLGVSNCQAKDFANTYEINGLTKIYTLACLACPNNPQNGFEMDCEGCYPEGEMPPSMSSIIQGLRK